VSDTFSELLGLFLENVGFRKNTFSRLILAFVSDCSLR
jgi:hypothetical protein